MTHLMKKLWKLVLIPAVVLLALAGVSIFAYTTRFDPADYLEAKWTPNQLKETLNVVKDGYANAYNNIPDVDRKTLREEGKLTLDDIIWDSKKLTEVSKEANRAKAKIILNSVINKIKSYDKSVKLVFQVTVTRLEVIRNRL